MTFVHKINRLLLTFAPYYCLYTEKVEGQGTATILTTIGAYGLCAALKVIFLALTSSQDSLEDNWSRILKHGVVFIDLAIIMYLQKQQSMNTGLKRDTLFCISFGWSIAEAVAVNVLKIIVSDSGEELELKDIVDAFMNIFQ